MKSNRIILSLIATLLLGAFPVSVVFAQAPDVQAARTRAEKTVEKAAGVQAPETVEATRAAIDSILDLTTAELQDVMSDAKLGSVTEQDDAGLASIARQLQQRLIMYSTYVDFLRTQVNAATQTIDSLKAIAATFKKWREQAYDPAIRQAFDAVLLSQSNGVLLTAQRRFEKVNGDVKKLQNSRGIAANALVALLEDARQKLVNAADEQNTARQILTENQKTWNSLVYEGVIGAPQVITLKRGPDGDFACAPGAAPKTCPLIFQYTRGGYYLLFTSSGDPATYAVSDLARVSGTALTFGEDRTTGLIGVFFIETINGSAVPVKTATDVETPFTASATDAIASPPTVQSLIKKVLKNIDEAYKDFFAMVPLARKLSASAK